jgi:hypothetical protein
VTRYLEHVTRFVRHFRRSPARLGPEEIRAYQLYLTNDRQLAVASLHLAVAALRFLYRVTLKKEWAVIRVDQGKPGCWRCCVTGGASRTPAAGCFRARCRRDRSAATPWNARVSERGGGGLAPDRTRWVSWQPGFFLPVRVLSRLFRRLVLEALHTAFEAAPHDDREPVHAAVSRSICPACQHGRLIIVGYLAPDRLVPVIPDTS